MSNSLKKVHKKLKNYFTFFKTSDIIIVSLDKTELPFAYIIEDKNYPDKLLVSFAVDFPNCNDAASIVLEINAIKEVIITEGFYISNNGYTSWGDDAHRLFNIDNFIDLEDLDAISEELN